MQQSFSFLLTFDGGNSSLSLWGFFICLCCFGNDLLYLNVGIFLANSAEVLSC